MRFFAAFTLLLVAIATVQSIPVIPQVNDLNALAGAFPQELMNQLTTLGGQIASALTPTQLQTLEKQVIQLAEKVYSGQIDIYTAANQLLQQVQQYLGSNSPLLNNIQPFMQQLLSVIATVLPNLSANIGTRSASIPASINQLSLNDLNAIIAANPEFANLISQFQMIADEVMKALSPAQLQSLQLQAMQAGQDVYSGKVDITTALHHLLQQVQQFLEPNSALFNNLQSIVQQLLNVFLKAFPNWSSSFGQTRAAVARNDFSSFINQIPAHDLNAIIAAYPQFADLINKLSILAEKIEDALSSEQLESLKLQAMQVAQDVFNGKVDIHAAINELFTQIQQYLGTKAHILNDVQPTIEQLLDAVFTFFPHLSSGVSQTRARTDISSLINQLPMNDLNALLAGNSQFANLVSQLQIVADKIVNALSQQQLESLELQAMQVAQDVFSGKIDVTAALNQLFQQVQQYLGANSQVLNNAQPLVQQLLDAIFTVFPNSS